MLDYLVVAHMLILLYGILEHVYIASMRFSFPVGMSHL